MAKWGEGDPRWIVEERADATNVNNWHWTEKNATNWSRDKLKELFVGITIESEKGSCEITEITKCEGEATASNRKAKLIFFYEWDIKLEWKGNLKDCETKLTGYVEIPNLSDENDADDVDFTVTVKKESDESRTLKDLMRKTGVEVLRKQVATYMTSLREEFSQGMILPTKGAPNANTKQNQNNQKQPQKKNGVVSQAKEVKNASLGVKIPTSNIEDKQQFKCRACELYEVLTDAQRVQVFMRSKVEMEVEPEGRFTLLDGNISGQFVQLVPNKKIVQKWRFKSWPEEHHSTVTIELEEKSDHTSLKMTQTGVPTNELERTKEGWERYYWQSIKSTFGFGASLF